jgi:lipopolysaccharide export system protein LptC
LTWYAPDIFKKDPATLSGIISDVQNMQTKGIFSLVILAALAILSGWLLITVKSTLYEADKNTSIPPLYMDNFQATRMNIQGIREYTLTANHLVQLPGEQGTRVEQPKIAMFQNGQIREWLLSAEHAWIAPDNQLIRLEQGVSLSRPLTSGKRPVVITSRVLLIYPDQDLAETTEAVHAETPGGVVDAVGLKARLNEEQLELLSDVRGSYESPNL